MEGNRPRSTGVRRVDLTGATPPVAVPPPAEPSVGRGASGASQPPVASPPASAPTGVQAAQLESLTRDVRTGLDSARQSATTLRASIAAARAEQSATVAERAASRKAADEATREASLARLAAQTRAAADGAAEAFRAALARLAPGAGSEEIIPESHDGPVPRAMRFGCIESPTALVGQPAVAPFLSTAGWWITGDRADALDLVVSTVARVVSSVPSRNLRVITWDPRLGGELGVFARLRDVRAATFPTALTRADELAAVLESLVASAAETAERIRGAGASELAGLWEKDGPSGEQVVLVLLDYPVGIDERTHSLIVRLAETAAPLGVSILAQVDAGAVPPKDVDPAALSRHLECIECRGRRRILAGLPDGVVVASDARVDRTTIDGIVSAAVAAGSVGPSVTLSELLTSEPWSRSSRSELSAAIGRSGREPLVLELRSENPPLPNMLIGGAVGQGKSNLLLSIVYSLAHAYSPDELEFLLLDFKQGLEFQRFDRDDAGEAWLPHARVLSLESNRAFGLAVLDHVVAELTRRSEAFKKVRANSIDDYRTKTGERMPRQLLVIDEFQMLFDGMDDVTDTAVARLEQLAKQGRAYGIHLVLATQALSGISGLRVKGDAIFAQFPLRVSLKNTVDESQALLSTGNRAAAELTYRGEVVVNRNFGLDPEGANEFGVVAYVEPVAASGLQRALWERSPMTPPLVFFGARAAAWPPRSLPERAPDGALEAWIGMPIAISDEPARITITADVEQGVALIGRGDEEAQAVLSSATATALRGLPSGARIVLLDGDDASADDPEWFSAATASAASRGVTVRRVRRAGISAYLRDELAPALQEVTPTSTLIIGSGMQRVADLADEALVDPDDDFGPRTSAAMVLQDAAERGALKGISVIAWWSTPQSATAHLGYNHRGFGSFVLLSMGIDDLRGFAGPHAQRPEGSPRVLLLDRKTGDPEWEVVPFELDAIREAVR